MTARLLLFIAILFGSGAASLGIAAAEGGAPKIRSVHRKVVLIDVPRGYSSVTLQQRGGRNAKSWRILATRKVGQGGGAIRIALKRAVPRRGLFVSGKRIKTAPDPVNGPITSFLADPALVASGGFSGAEGATSPVVNMARAAGDSVTTSGTSSTSASREVSESDIWRIDGERLYFFNQLRGLQVFDIADPDAPMMLGQLREPNRGEQMYLLDTDHVALLTRASYYFSLANRPFTLAEKSSSAYRAGSGSIVIADVSEGRPEAVARVSYPGYFVESRLVGTALYIVSQVYDRAGTQGLLVSSYDLADPANPRLSDQLELGSYGDVISATDRYLFVVKSAEDWRRSIVEVVDISAPDGSLVKRGQIPVAGRIPDKFKLNLEGDFLTVVSEVPRNWNGNWNAPQNQPRTMVETFSLVNPVAPAKLGSLELGVGESLHASRFSGDRLYVVTFLTIDPLWVVDLSNPAEPTLLGELEIPGFSTYIEPLGDRLVAIGRLDSRTAVSLFDVSDPKSPALLSQLPLGDAYSYSEANWDEKAFSVFPEDNLILVPYSGYDGASGWASRIQLIDLERDALNKRGIVDQGFAARRTAVIDDRILAISPSALITVDFEDRDRPVVTSDVEIAWRVDRVFLSGDYLVQIGGSADWTRTSPPSITIATPDDPDRTVNLIELEDVPVTGAAVRNGKLYLAQQDSEVRLPIYKASNGTAVQAPAHPLILSVFDLSGLPALTRIGRTEAKVDPGYGYGAGQLEPAWPDDDTLVWIREQWASWWWYDRPMVAMNDVAVPAAGAVTLAPSGSVAVANVNLEAAGESVARRAIADDAAIASSQVVSRLIAPWYRTSVGQEMVVFDVSEDSAPAFASIVNARIGNTGDWSAPVARDGKLHLSYLAYDNNRIANGISRNFRHYLKSVDFTDSRSPVVSAEVNIPGRLLSVGQDGKTLLTLGCAFEKDGVPRSTRAFHTSHFDGTRAILIDQLRTPFSVDPFAIDGDTLLTGSDSAAGKSPGASIKAWQINAGGRFVLVGEVSADRYHSLATLNGLLVGFGDDLPQIFDISDPGNPSRLDGIDTSDLTIGDLGKSDGGAGLGIWQPQGNSGVGVVRLSN